MKPTAYDLTVIKIIAERRKRANEKQANLAAALSITQPEYCKIEKGQRTLSVGSLERICKCLKLEMSELIFLASSTTDNKEAL